LAQNEDNVSELGDMSICELGDVSICGLLLQ